jgi:hypothetical protein
MTVGRTITDLTDPTWRRLFTDFERSAFRLETLQRYDVGYENEPLRAFIAGEPRPADPSKDRWTGLVRGHVAAGRSISRVHVVREPLTPYLRYELTWSYGDNVAAGEDIRIISGPLGQWPGTLPRHDFWLFDDRALWVMHYATGGQFVQAEQVDDRNRLARHAHWREVALAAGAPWWEYVRNHPDLSLRHVS